MSYLEYLDNPTPENIEAVHQASGLQIREAAAVANISYDTYKSWRSSAKSKNSRTPHVMSWNLYLYELEARRLEFEDLKSLMKYFD